MESKLDEIQEENIVVESFSGNILNENPIRKQKKKSLEPEDINNIISMIASDKQKKAFSILGQINKKISEMEEEGVDILDNEIKVFTDGYMKSVPI